MPPAARRVAPASTPLWWLTGGLLLGQLAALVVAGRAPGVVALAVAGAWLLRRGAWRRWPIALAAVAAAIGHAQLDATLRPPDDAARIEHWAGSEVAVRARVAATPTRLHGRTRLLLEVAAVRQAGAWQRAGGRVQLTLQRVSQGWRAGDELEATLRLRRPRNFGNPGEFDYEAFLARRGVFCTAFAADDGTWVRRPAVVTGLGGALEDWRGAVAATIAATLPGTPGAIAAALLIGELDAIDPAVRARFARAGVSHVLSISGLHVGLVAAGAYAAARWLLARSRRLLLYTNVPKLAVALSLGPLLVYAAIAGANVATLRAEIMAVLVVSALLLDRPRDWMAPLAAAAAAISAALPGSLSEISFQLSFVAVLALVLGVPRLTARWDRWEDAHLIRLRDRRWRWLRWMVVSQAVTVCAWLGTAPLTAWHFNQISLIALVANPLVVPLLGVATVGIGLIATAAVAVAPPLAPPLFAVIGIAIGLADWLVARCAALPGASIRVVTPSILELLLLYGLLAVPLLGRGRARRTLAVACAAGLLIDAGYWSWERACASELRVTFLSVGQGDCTVIELPRGPVVVIDGGGLSNTFDVGERVVAPFLWRRKIRRVDALALSHADFDHFGGLTFLAEQFAPAELWWNGSPAEGIRFAELDAALTAAGVARRTLARGDRWTMAGVEIEVLHPPARAGGSDNDRSLTLRLRYGGTALLFPGDLEAAGEAALVAAVGPAARSAILKVPHHGSRSSSSAALLASVRPRFAVVSVGADNRWHFPHPTVLDAYRAAGVRLLRTDRDGAVTIRVAADGAIAVEPTRGESIRAR